MNSERIKSLWETLRIYNTGDVFWSPQEKEKAVAEIEKELEEELGTKEIYFVN